MRSTQQFSITLPNEMAQLVRSKVSSGEYASESEVIRDGLRALIARDNAINAWLVNEVGPAYETIRNDPSRGIEAKNVMTICGYQAVITYEPDIEMLRGEFVGLNGGADFYASDIDGLHREGEASLKVFLEECAIRGVEPRKGFSGKFVLRVAPEVHEAAVIAAAASGESLNQWVAAAIREAALA